MEVQRVEGITFAAFMQEFYQPGIPVIFKNTSKSWNAKGLFSPDWFRSYCGYRQTSVAGKLFTMRQILDMVENCSINQPAPYPRIFNIPETLPEILELIQPLHLNYARPNWLESNWFTRGLWGSAAKLFIGGPGVRFPSVHLNYFHLNAWAGQVCKLDNTLNQ